MRAVKQQHLHAWTPIITACPLISFLFVMSLVCFIIGSVWVGFTYGQVVQTKVFRYDNLCLIGSKCTFRFRVEEDLKQPVFLYYYLEEFYQNHRRYAQSRHDGQLRGDVTVNDYGTLNGNCDPTTSLGDSHDSNKVFLPCGLIALSFFNGSSLCPRSGASFMALVVILFTPPPPLLAPHRYDGGAT